MKMYRVVPQSKRTIQKYINNEPNYSLYSPIPVTRGSLDFNIFYTERTMR